MTKILFLDIDGVLNSDTWFVKTNGNVPEHNIDRAAVALLNDVVRRTGCKIVISSSWRHFFPRVKKMQEVLDLFGFQGEVIGMTATTFRKSKRSLMAGPGHDGVFHSPVNRGMEIHEWLKVHEEVKRFAIVDDCEDMAHLKDRCVYTNDEVGITLDDVEKLVALLGEIK